MRFLSALFCGALCFCLVGCGDSYPYYTLEGSAEGRTVIVHIDESTTKRVPVGTGIGAGLTGSQKTMLMAGETVTVEKDGVTVKLASKVVPVVTEVVYEAEEIRFHEPIL